MISLLNIVKSQIEELVKDLVFDDPDPDSSNTALRFYVGSLPPKRAGDSTGHDIPLCLLTAPTFTWPRSATSTAVRAEFAIYHADDQAADRVTNHNAGLAKLDALAEALKPIATLTFQPFKRVGEITGAFGDENGSNPHPHYYLVLNMEFTNPRA